MSTASSSPAWNMGDQAPGRRTRHPPPVPAAVRRSTGFVIDDDIEAGDPLVHIEWLPRPYNKTEPEAVETCRQAFANLLGTSATGNAARRLISAAAHDLQTGDD